MKKDGIQTRNRKLATKAKRRKSFMHDFFRSSFDSRFMYSNMGPSYLAAAAASNPMSQYYAGQMSAMQPFMGTAAASHLDMTHHAAAAAAAHNSSSPSPSSNGELYHGQSAAYPAGAGGEDAMAAAASVAHQAQAISSNGNGIAANGASGGGGGGSATSMIGASA